MSDTTVNLAQITAALNQVYEKIVPVRNDAVPFLSWLPKKRNTTGKNVAWTYKTGTDIGAYIAEGSDQADFETNTKLAATLNTAEYSSGVHITQKAINAAMNSSGAEGVVAILTAEFQDAVEMLTKSLNPEVIRGSTSGGIVGLYVSTTGALAASGTYAGLDRGTYPQLAATVSNNPAASGTNRPIEMSILRAMRTSIFDASGRKAKAIWGSPQVVDKYLELHDSRRRFNDTMGKLDSGTSAIGPRAEFDGIPMYEDSDWNDNQLIFCDTSEMALVYQPDVVTPNTTPVGYVTLVGHSEAQGISGGTGLMARVNRLAQNGNAHRFQLITEVQLQVKRGNAFGVLNDILT